MRVLFSVVPGPGHMFPTIALAWALRAAGHDVLYATAAGGVLPDWLWGPAERPGGGWPRAK
jgi:hypothetical protein